MLPQPASEPLCSSRDLVLGCQRGNPSLTTHLPTQAQETPPTSSKISCRRRAGSCKLLDVFLLLKPPQTPEPVTPSVYKVLNVS